MTSLESSYANEKFYEWEKQLFGDHSPLTDDDRLLWIAGYHFARLETTNEEN